MCKKSTVVYGDYIGRRMVGWCVFNGKDYSFLSEKQVKARLQIKEQVNGLTLDEAGNVVIDREFTRNLMGKSGLTFAPIMEADDDGDEAALSKYYALVKVTKDKRYCFVTNRCGYEVLNEEQVKAMMDVFIFGGIRMSDGGDLVIHSNVDVEDVAECADKSTKKAKGKQEGVTV